MTTHIVDRAAEVIAKANLARRERRPHADVHIVTQQAAHDYARALADAGLLAPEPQIIRTREELAALDPDTLVIADSTLTRRWSTHRQKSAYRAADAHLLDLTWQGPVVVIATGDQVRAARQALKEEVG